MLESLVRLAQAHARLCFKDTVEVEDAIVVVDAMETSIVSADGDDDRVGPSSMHSKMAAIF